MEENHENIDLIKTDYKKAIRNFSITMMSSLIFLMLYNVTDSIFVSGINFDALSALGFVNPLYMFIISIAQGLGTAMVSVMSRYIGAEEKEKANNVIWHTIIITVIISIILLIFAFTGLKDILILMGAKSVINYAMDYAQILFIFSIILILNTVLSSILRSEGDMKRATYCMIGGCILNIILDPIFIFLLGLGMKGAAIATILASAIPIIILTYWIFIKKNTYLKTSIKHYKHNIKHYKEIISLAVPATLEGFVTNFLFIFVNLMLVTIGGNLEVAGFTGAWRIITVGLIPSLAIEAAILTVAGVFIGAKNWVKVNDIYKYSIKFSMGISTIIAIVLFIFSNEISYLFVALNNEYELAGIISKIIKLFAIYIIVMPLGLTSTAMFQASGKGFTSLFLVILRDMLLSIICAYILGFVFNFGITGIFVGIVIGMIIAAIFSYCYFTRYLKTVS